LHKVITRHSTAVPILLGLETATNQLQHCTNTPSPPRLRPYCDCTATNFLAKSR